MWETLKAASVEFRRGQLHLIASGPGIGKSAFALNLAIKAKVPGIYLSADSDSSTQYARAAALMTGHRVADIQAQMDRNQVTEYDRALARLTWLRFDFEAVPTLGSIEEIITAYGHAYYRYPELFILDNLSNVSPETGRETFQALDDTLVFLQDFARKTRACVVVLHHLTGAYEDGTGPAPLSGLRGKVSKIPELVLNLYKESDQFGETLGVAIVKNRNGLAAPDGSMTVTLAADLDRMSISDPTHDMWQVV